jgi:hypothetical protein
VKSSQPLAKVPEHLEELQGGEAEPLQDALGKAPEHPARKQLSLARIVALKLIKMDLIALE